MPPNMMKALVGSSPNVTGRRSATVSAGPMPGSTPTAVPSVTPANAQARWGQVSALANPARRSSIVSTGLEPARQQPGGQRQLQDAGEQDVRRGREAQREETVT